MSQLHYPEEWGPSNDRKLTCSCGHPDPAHRDPKVPTPTDAAACKWETYPGRERFRVWKEDPENAHSAWFVVFPGPHGTSLAINHNNDDTVDEARANWIAHALNTALAAPTPAVAPSEAPSDFQLEQLFDAAHEHGQFGREFREHARSILATPTEAKCDGPSECPILPRKP